MSQSKIYSNTDETDEEQPARETEWIVSRTRRRKEKFHLASPQQQTSTTDQTLKGKESRPRPPPVNLV